MRGWTNIRLGMRTIIVILQIENQWSIIRYRYSTLPNWWIGAKEVALITPSSFTIERVFSLLSQCMYDNRRSALENYMCGSVLVRYNRIWTDPLP